MKLKLHTSLLVFAFIAFALCNDEDLEDGVPTDDYVPPKFESPTIASDEVYFLDWFNDVNAIGKTWYKSKSKKDGTDFAYTGNFQIAPPSNIVLDGDLGLVVKNRARHHAIASRLNKPFDFTGKPLILQYEVKYEEGQECGGGYLKLLTAAAVNDITQFSDQTPYTIMFGPDKCGPNARVHFILKVKNPKTGIISEHLVKTVQHNFVTYFEDKLTHLYTLTINPDNTFSIQVDNIVIVSGNIQDQLTPPIEPPQKIEDPTDTKPSDWDDREVINDPHATKPDDWDESQPKEIVDSSASKPFDWLDDESSLISDPSAIQPEDWDDDLDGEWEPKLISNPRCEGISGCGPWTQPLIANPLYKGKWVVPKIRNPEYKGKFVPRQIDNPDYYKPDPYKQLTPIHAVGLELWTMSNNIVLDNILITDDAEIAHRLSAETFTVKHSAEVAFNNAKNPQQGILESLVNATEEHPWLWVVYILALLVPTIILSIYCCGRTSRSSGVAAYKKDDDLLNHDDEQDVDKDDEAVDEVDEQPSTSQGLNDAEDKSGSSLEDLNDTASSAASSRKNSPKQSTRPRVGRARKE